MNHITQKNIYQLLDVPDLDLICDGYHGGQHVLEVPKTILFYISLKKIGINDLSYMTKKNIDQLLDILDQDLIVDVHQGKQQVPEVPKTIFILFPFKKNRYK